MYDYYEEDSREVKVIKVEMYITDFQEFGAEEIKYMLEERVKGIHGRVISMESKSVDWTDEHPLNSKDTQTEAYNKLFNTGRTGVCYE